MNKVMLGTLLSVLYWIFTSSPVFAQAWARDEFTLCRTYNRLVRMCIEVSPAIREAQCPAMNGMSRREIATRLANRIETIPEDRKPVLIEFMVRECSRYL